MEQAWDEGPLDAPDGEAPPEPIAVEADLASAINYACWQNSVPIVRSLRIVNNTDLPAQRPPPRADLDPRFCPAQDMDG